MVKISGYRLRNKISSDRLTGYLISFAVAVLMAVYLYMGTQTEENKIRSLFRQHFSHAQNENVHGYESTLARSCDRARYVQQAERIFKDQDISYVYEVEWMLIGEGTAEVRINQTTKFRNQELRDRYTSKLLKENGKWKICGRIG